MAVFKTVVTYKMKHLQNICKNVLVFLRVATSEKNVLQMFYAKPFEKCCTTFAKHFYHVEHSHVEDRRWLHIK